MRPHLSPEPNPRLIDEGSLRSLTHELRTPLTTLLGYAQLLQRDDRASDPVLVRDGLSLIESKAKQMSRAVSRLAEFADPSSVDRGELSAARGTLSDLVGSLAAGASIDVRFSSEADHAAIDRQSAQTVLRELLDNATRFGEGATVVVRGALEGSPRRLVVRVSNEGPGISEGSRDAIFAPFAHGQEHMVTPRAGMGLGLAMARRVAEAAYGNLTLESGHPVTFRVELPLTSDPIADQFRALNERAAGAQEDAVRAARMLAAARGETERHRLRRELEAAHEQQLRVVEDFRSLHRQALDLTTRLDRVYFEITAALARAVEARDEYTGSHVERVSRASVQIATALGLAGDALRHIEFGGVLHDVGKIGVPDAILGKPGALTPDEWDAMRRHPEVGRRVLEGIAFLGPALDAVAHHHERWDGRGYPFGLSRDAIPLAGRIVAVADAYDAMTTDRPYRRGLSHETAVGELDRGRGTAFDPEIVDAFIGTFRIAS